MEYQAYAYAEDGTLAHAGPFFLREGDTLEATVRKVERAWRRWRNRYLRENPAARSSPLGDRRNGKTYMVHHVGSPDRAVQVAVIPQVRA